MKIHSLALALALGVPLSSAFAPTQRQTHLRPASSRAASIVSEDLMMPAPAQEKKADSLPQVLQDRKGVALSGLEGKALEMADDQYPSAFDIRKVIPEECFEPDTAKSLGYLSISLASTALCTAGGLAALSILDPANPLTFPFWAAYAAVTGTVAMGNWVLAHECGHGKFQREWPPRESTWRVNPSWSTNDEKAVVYDFLTTRISHPRHPSLYLCRRLFQEQNAARHGRIRFAFHHVGALLFVATISCRSSPVYQPHGIGRNACAGTGD